MKLVDANQVAEIELIYKSNVKASQRPKITCSKDAYHIVIQTWDENKIDFVEQAKVILLNKSGKVLGVCEISTGGVSATVVDPKLVYAAAIKANASDIVMVHNHPTGNLRPSEHDRRLTQKLKEGGNYLEVRFLDHLIVSSEGYYSFSDDETYTVTQSQFSPPC